MHDLTGRLSLIGFAGRDRLARPVPFPRTPAPCTWRAAVGCAVGERVRSLRSARGISPGATGEPDTRHVVVQPDSGAHPATSSAGPRTSALRSRRSECLRLVTVEAVHRAAARLSLSPAASPPRGGRGVKTLAIVAGSALPPDWVAATVVASGRAGGTGAARGQARRCTVAPGLRCGSRGRGGHRGRALDEGVGPAASSRRPQLPRSLRMEGRVALVVRRAVPPPLDGGHARSCGSSRPSPGCSTRRGRTRWKRHGLPKTRRFSPPGPAWRAECCSMAAPCSARRVAAVSAVRRRARWNALKAWATAAKARGLRPPRPRLVRGARVALFLSHAAFWRERTSDAGCAARVRALLRPVDPRPGRGRRAPAVRGAVGRGPPSAGAGWASGWRTGCTCTETARATSTSTASLPSGRARGATGDARSPRASGRSCPSRAAVRETFSHRGVTFADLSEQDLAATLLLQLPWAIRSYEEMAAVLAAVRPAVVPLRRVQRMGPRRPRRLPCRPRPRRGRAARDRLRELLLVPRTTSDEAACPRPERTAVFGEDGAAPPPRGSATTRPDDAGHDGQSQARPAPGRRAHAGTAAATRAPLAVPAGRAPWWSVAEPVSRHPATRISRSGARCRRSCARWRRCGVTRRRSSRHPAEGDEDYAAVLRADGRTRAHGRPRRRRPHPARCTPRTLW